MSTTILLLILLAPLWTYVVVRMAARAVLRSIAEKEARDAYAFEEAIKRAARKEPAQEGDAGGCPTECRA